MKTLLVKALLFLLGLWLLVYLLAGLAERYAPLNVYRHRETDMFDILRARQDSLKAVALGNSHSGAIDFETLEMEGQRLPRAGTDLFEVKLYADSVAAILPELDTVFIAVSYFSFSNNNVLRDDTRNLRIELYGMLPGWIALPGDADSLLLGKLDRYFYVMNVARPDNWKEVLDNALAGETPGEYQPDYQAVTDTGWGRCAHFTEPEIREIGYEIGYKAAISHLRFVEIDPNIPAQAQQALEDTIIQLKQHGVRVVLFTPPYHQSYNQRFMEISPEMVTGMQQALAKIQARHNVEYYDASALPEFSTRPDLFINSDHLNACGMRAFSVYLREAMARRDQELHDRE